MGNEMDQDKLAEEWAAALSESDDEDQDLDVTNGGDSALDDMLPGDESGDMDQDALADEWAQALAKDEGESLKKEKRQSLKNSL